MDLWGYICCTSQRVLRGEPIVPPFWGYPLSYKASPNNFSLQNANWQPPQYKWGRGGFGVIILYKHCRLEATNPFLEGAKLHFGGWNYLGGALWNRGDITQKVVLWLPTLFLEPRLLCFQPSRIWSLWTSSCNICKDFAWECINREVQTMNWEAGKEGAVETGVKRGLKKAHKPWIRGKKGAQTVI